MSRETRNIGVPVNPPPSTCKDINCPFHGHLKVRGVLLVGRVLKRLMKNSVVIEREYVQFIKKYKRYERRRTRIPAHLPPCIDASVNDTVRVAECRPISKTISFVVIERLTRGEST
ncbi:MAG: 30S ribosomal protein S17 [Nitrososphaerota archaeon]|nr:30S ribosomal protein S17 [Nitrososphaerota archaeon]